MAAQGLQLTTFLYGLYFGRRKMPALVSPLAASQTRSWALGVNEGPVEIGGQCRAVQVDNTTCGSAAIALAKASDPASAEARGLLGTDANPQSQFAELQHAIKVETNRRRWGLKWPHAWGTPPWGASREMTFAGHEYFDRMVVDTSLPQSTRVLTHAARCVQAGFPVLLYVGGDTSMGMGKGVPRHVVVLDKPPTPLDDPSQLENALGNPDIGSEAVSTENNVDTDIEAVMTQRLAELERKIAAKLSEARSAMQEPDFNPEMFIYEPSQGINTKVTLEELINKKCPPQAIGGWRHIMWAIMPKALEVHSGRSGSGV